MRAEFTVVAKGPSGEIHYDADVIMSTARDGDLHPMVTFVCSGKVMSLPAEDVERVEFIGAMAGWCSKCDQPLPTSASG